MLTKMPYRVALTIAALLCAVTIAALYTYSFTNFTIERQGGAAEAATFPFKERAKHPSGIYTLEGELQVRPLSPKRFQIIPDDRLIDLQINGQPVDLSEVPREKLSDWNKGFTIDLKNHLSLGKNTIAFEFKDNGGAYGIAMYGDPLEPRLLPFAALFVVCLGIVVWTTLIALGLRRDLALLVLGGVFIRILYTLATGYDTRGHDTHEHIEYIMYFVDNWSLPDLEAAVGGAFFHPPFYYFVASIFYRFFDLFYPSQPGYLYGMLQYLSVAFSAGFLVYACKLTNLFFEQLRSYDKPLLNLGGQRLSLIKTVSFLCAALIIFWPSAILHSPRISNDPLLYFLFIGGLYHIYKFYLQPSVRQFFLGALLTSLAIITKANGAILVALGGLVLLAMYARRRPQLDIQLLKRGAIPVLLIMAALTLAFYPGIALKLSGKRTHLYVDNITNISSSLQVGNKASNYLWMDVPTFITKPYTSPFKDEYGRQYFANYLAKTSLVGEWSFSGDLAENTTTILSFCLLIIMILLLAGLYRLHRRDLPLLGPILCVHFLLVASVYYMRITFPANIDFRYILPSIVPLALLLNYGMVRFSDTGSTRLTLIGCGVQITFVVSAILFILHLNL